METANINKLIRQYKNDPSKFRTKNLVETNDESRGDYCKINKLNLKLQ